MSVKRIHLNGSSKLPIDAYYDATRKGYWILDRDGNWMTIEKESLKMRLAQAGYSPRRAEGDAISAADAQILRIQDERSVNYVGAVAGYEKGLYEMSGYKVLVTHSARPLRASPGSWCKIKAILEQLLVTQEQLTHLYGWIKLGDISLTSGNITYGQALVLAGPKCCGKSLVQALITELYGGRAAKPYRFMMGRTEFNKELLGAEHLTIEDEAASLDLRTRRNFGAAIKLITATKEHSGHGKGKDAVTLQPFWRLSISINDEPENLSILPPIDESLEDKLIILKCSMAKMPMPTTNAIEEAAFWAALMEELPAFLYWIRHEFVIPPDFVAARYGLTHYVHPELLRIIDGLAPQTRLLALIDHSLFSSTQLERTDTTEELQRSLCDGPYQHEARQLLAFPTAMGTYLGRLAKSHPERVKKGTRRNDKQLWTLVADASAIDRACDIDGPEIGA